MLQIIEEESFRRCVADLRIEYKRLDEAMDGVRFALCRHPETFPLVIGTYISRVRIEGCLGVPDSDVWFTYDNECVRLIHLELLPS